MRPLVLTLAVLLTAGCGSPSGQAGDDAARDDQQSSETGEAAPETSAGAAVIAPLPEGTKLTLKFKGTVTAARQLADSDPLGARSDFKILRSFDLTCRMVTTGPRGIGPDGPTREQKAILDAAEAQSDAAAADMEAGSDTGDIEARAAACNDDFACLARVATEAAKDPEARKRLESAEERNAGLGDRMADAADRVTAVQLEPNWQFLAPDVSPYGGEAACAGEITVNDADVFRFGFDGGDMGEGVKSRSGSGEADGGGAPEVWFDLKGGRLIIDTQLNGIRATIPANCTGECEASWNDVVTINDDWGASAGEVTRLEKGGETKVTGKRLLASEILPEKHNRFSGGGAFELEIIEN